MLAGNWWHSGVQENGWHTGVQKIVGRSFTAKNGKEMTLRMKIYVKRGSFKGEKKKTKIFRLRKKNRKDLGKKLWGTKTQEESKTGRDWEADDEIGQNTCKHKYHSSAFVRIGAFITARASIRGVGQIKKKQQYRFNTWNYLQNTPIYQFFWILKILCLKKVLICTETL